MTGVIVGHYGYQGLSKQGVSAHFDEPGVTCLQIHPLRARQVQRLVIHADLRLRTPERNQHEGGSHATAELRRRPMEPLRGRPKSQGSRLNDQGYRVLSNEHSTFATCNLKTTSLAHGSLALVNRLSFLMLAPGNSSPPPREMFNAQCSMHNVQVRNGGEH